MDKSKRIYISGPMTGHPEFNYPAFHRAEEILQEAGFMDIYNPAKVPQQESWQAYMDIHIPEVHKSSSVALLPGWGMSPGARKEVHEALSRDVHVDLFQNFLNLTYSQVELVMLEVSPPGIRERAMINSVWSDPTRIKPTLQEFTELRKKILMTTTPMLRGKSWVQEVIEGKENASS